MVGGSFVAAIGWIQVSQLNQNPIEKSDEIALFIHSSLFTLLGLLAVLGFVGALIKNRPMIKSFAVALAIHLGFSVASGIFSIYTMFTDNPKEAVAKCLEKAADTATTKETCTTNVALLKGVLVAVYVITWLIQLYAYFIVERYADQLDDEEAAANTVVIPRSMAMEIGAPQVTTYSGFAPTYPFTEPRQAFGVTRGQDPSNMA